MSDTEQKRIASIDLLRGAVMILMALDHVRWFFHADAAVNSPTNLETTTAALFFTRWVTHFCASVFLFLVGLSAFLVKEKRGPAYSSHFLATRGLMLIFLELFVFRLGWDYHYFRSSIDLLVIWMIGINMIALAGIMRLPVKWVVGLGLLIIFTHNLLVYVPITQESGLYPFWVFFYQGGWIPVSDHFYISVLFSFLPYFGIVCLGYGFGKLYQNDFPAVKRRRVLTQAGVAFILLFFLIRGINLYGDPRPWSAQKNSLFTFLSFINTTKYPTSLLYTLMTLGPALLLLARTERAARKILDFGVQIGRVPMFYYILHLFLIQLLAQTASLVFTGKPEIQKFSLPAVYGVWILVNLVLYPVCAWYGRYKNAHPEKKWLSYI